jgi:hypothetical protein
MKTWFRCPCCRETFLGEVAETKLRGRAAWPSGPRISQVFRVTCPSVDCGQSFCGVITLPSARVYDWSPRVAEALSA